MKTQTIEVEVPEEMMTEWIEIPISKNQSAIVDKEDLDLVNSRKWKAKWSKNTNSYVAVRCSSMVSGKRGSVYMHRLITGAPKGFVVDHINHNTLDNRKRNLRIVSHSDNQKNSRLKSHNTSGVCGSFLEQTSQQMAITNYVLWKIYASWVFLKSV